MVRRPQVQKRPARLLKTAQPSSYQVIVDAVPDMGFADQIAAWRNCVRLLADPKREDWHFGAKTVLATLERRWRQIGMDPANADGYFRWPSASAEKGGGSFSDIDFVKEGILGLLGYRVGNTNGEAEPIRQAILAKVFEGTLPPVESPRYMDEWAQPRSPQRLEKMAHSLAAFIRNAKRRRSPSLRQAINEWTIDLERLREIYYVGHFRFAWPDHQQ